MTKTAICGLKGTAYSSLLEPSISHSFEIEAKVKWGKGKCSRFTKYIAAHLEIWNFFSTFFLEIRLMPLNIKLIVEIP